MSRFSLHIISLFLLAFTNTTHAQHTVSDLAGRWESEDGTTGSIQFTEDAKVTISINGLVIPATTYSIDFSKTPIWFDVVLTPSRTVKGLMEFIDDDTVRWQISMEGDRNLDFNVNDPVFVLKRKK